MVKSINYNKTTKTQLETLKKKKQYNTYTRTLTTGKKNGKAGAVIKIA